MIQLDMTRAEAQTLREALESYLSDLRMEIVDTDQQDFREGLKRKKEVLERVLDQLDRVMG